MNHQSLHGRLLSVSSVFIQHELNFFKAVYQILIICLKKVKTGRKPSFLFCVMLAELSSTLFILLVRTLTKTKAC